jgi:hypothetical protein
MTEDIKLIDRKSHELSRLIRQAATSLLHKFCKATVGRMLLGGQAMGFVDILRPFLHFVPAQCSSPTIMNALRL